MVYCSTSQNPAGRVLWESREIRKDMGVFFRLATRISKVTSEEGCKDEKNTVILGCHASNPAYIRFAWRYKVSEA
jgi:hypothetical protein